MVIVVEVLMKGEQHTEPHAGEACRQGRKAAWAALEQLLAGALETLGLELAVLSLAADKGSRVLRVVDHAGLGVKAGDPWPRSHSRKGDAWRSDRAVAVADWGASPRGKQTARTSALLRAYLDVPWRTRDGRQGTLTLASTKANPRDFAPAQLALAEWLGQLTARLIPEESSLSMPAASSPTHDGWPQASEPGADGFRNTAEITQRVSLEDKLRQRTAELERSNRDLETFALAASHDLREPLRTVHQFCKLLSVHYAPQLDEQGREWVEAVMAGAERMNRMVQGLWELSRTGREQSLARSLVPLDDALDIALANMRKTIAAREAHISRAALPTVLGDSILLGQFFQNLLGNAIKFTEGAPEITVAPAPGAPEGHCRIAVTDNGPGIPADQRQEVLQPFRRLHTGRGDGVGLGLTLCRRIVETHGGRLWIASAPGGGTQVLAELPTAALPETAQAPPGCQERNERCYG